MHIWVGYPPYRNLLRGGHLPDFCLNVTQVDVDFKAFSPIPAFEVSGIFPSYVFDIVFDGVQNLHTKLTSCVVKTELESCLTKGCYLCNST